MEGLGFDFGIIRGFIGQVENGRDFRVIRFGILFANIVIIIGNSDINIRLELFNKFTTALTFEIK